MDEEDISCICYMYITLMVCGSHTHTTIRLTLWDRGHIHHMHKISYSHDYKIHTRWDRGHIYQIHKIIIRINRVSKDLAPKKKKEQKNRILNFYSEWFSFSYIFCSTPQPDLEPNLSPKIKPNTRPLYATIKRISCRT